MARNKNKTYKTLLSVLANGSTEQARDLLTRHSGGDAQDVKDLEIKLARVYATSSNKKDIEREFAQIHPHKDFILKYVTAKEEIKPLEAIHDQVVKPIENSGTKKMVMVHDGYANADGCEQTCGCPKCMGYSNASGEQPQSVDKGNQNIMVLGIVSVVAILGMVLYINKNK